MYLVMAPWIAEYCKHFCTYLLCISYGTQSWDAQHGFHGNTIILYDLRVSTKSPDEEYQRTIMNCQPSLGVTWGPWALEDLRILRVWRQTLANGYCWEGIYSFQWISKVSQDSKQIKNHSHFLVSYHPVLPKCSRWYLRINRGKR